MQKRSVRGTLLRNEASVSKSWTRAILAIGSVIVASIMMGCQADHGASNVVLNNYDVNLTVNRDGIASDAPHPTHDRGLGKPQLTVSIYVTAPAALDGYDIVCIHPRTRDKVGKVAGVKPYPIGLHKDKHVGIGMCNLKPGTYGFALVDPAQTRTIDTLARITVI